MPYTREQLERIEQVLPNVVTTMIRPEEALFRISSEEVINTQNRKQTYPIRGTIAAMAKRTWEQKDIGIVCVIFRTTSKRAAEKWLHAWFMNGRINRLQESVEETAYALTLREHPYTNDDRDAQTVAVVTAFKALWATLLKNAGIETDRDLFLDHLADMIKRPDLTEDERKALIAEFEAWREMDGNDLMNE